MLIKFLGPVQFMSTLSKLKDNAPEIYKPETKFFSEVSGKCDKLPGGGFSEDSTHTFSC